MFHAEKMMSKSYCYHKVNMRVRIVGICIFPNFRNASHVWNAPDLLTLSLVAILLTGRFSANFATPRTLGLMDTGTGAVAVCRPWLPLTGHYHYHYHHHYHDIIIIRPGQYEEPRALIDFHPSVSDKEERVEGDEGCPRCGYRVFEAERMMAAGSVREKTFQLKIKLNVSSSELAPALLLVLAVLPSPGLDLGQ